MAKPPLIFLAAVRQSHVTWRFLSDGIAVVQHFKSSSASTASAGKKTTHLPSSHQRGQGNSLQQWGLFFFNLAVFSFLLSADWGCTARSSSRAGLWEPRQLEFCAKSGPETLPLPGKLSSELRDELQTLGKVACGLHRTDLYWDLGYKPPAAFISFLVGFGP